MTMDILFNFPDTKELGELTDDRELGEEVRDLADKCRICLNRPKPVQPTVSMSKCD